MFCISNAMPDFEPWCFKLPRKFSMKESRCVELFIFLPLILFRFDGKILNYRLLWDVEYKNVTGNFKDLSANIATCKFYLEDRRKCYHSLDAVVREGLITLHLDENA